jgi:hypothetical protein
LLLHPSEVTAAAFLSSQEGRRRWKVWGGGQAFDDPVHLQPSDEGSLSLLFFFRGEKG